MAGTALFALEPALERLFVFYVPGVPGFVEALYFAIISMEVITVALLVVDWRMTRRVHVPFVATLAFFVAMHALMTPVAQSAWFRDFAAWFAAI